MCVCACEKLRTKPGPAVSMTFVCVIITITTRLNCGLISRFIAQTSSINFQEENLFSNYKPPCSSSQLGAGF